MARTMSDISKLALDVINKNVQEYSMNEAEDKLREVLNKAVGGEWNYLNFQKNKWDVYAVLQQMLNPTVNKLMLEDFSDFIEVRDFALGDVVEFVVENPDLYTVSVSATGHNNIRRQKQLTSKIDINSFNLGVKIYANGRDYLAGKIDFATMTEKVRASFENEVATLASKTFQEAYENLHANFKATGNYSAETLVELCQKVKGKTGTPVAIFGTGMAISKIEGLTDVCKAEKRNFGHVKMFEGGIPVYEIKNTYDEVNDKWALANNLIYVVPMGNQKLIQVGYEGDAIISDDLNLLSRNDQTIEFMFQRMVHISCLTSKVFGAFELA